MEIVTPALIKISSSYFLELIKKSYQKYQTKTMDKVEKTQALILLTEFLKKAYSVKEDNLLLIIQILMHKMNEEYFYGTKILEKNIAKNKHELEHIYNRIKDINNNLNINILRDALVGLRSVIDNKEEEMKRIQLQSVLIQLAKNIFEVRNPIKKKLGIIKEIRYLNNSQKLRKLDSIKLLITIFGFMKLHSFINLTNILLTEGVDLKYIPNNKYNPIHVIVLHTVFNEIKQLKKEGLKEDFIVYVTYLRLLSIYF